MFQTIFLASLLAVYLAGYVTCVGLLISTFDDKKYKWTEYLLIPFIALLSWFAIGIKLSDR